MLASAAGLALAVGFAGAGSASASSTLGTRILENAMGNTCLSGGSSDGAQVVVAAPCNLGVDKAQNWTFSMAAGGSGTVKDGYGLCLDARNDSTSNPSDPGDPIQVWSCNGGSQQDWYVGVAFDQNGEQYIYLQNEDSAGGYVLDARNDANHSAGANGDPVQLWSYNKTLNQQWGVSSPIS